MRILFVGLGNLGSQVFDLFLLRGAKDHQFLVVGRNLEYIRQRTALPIAATIQLGMHPEVDYAFMDVWNSDQTAQVIASFKPDVIYTSITTLPSSAVSKLPEAAQKKFRHVKSGMWLPTTLVLIYKLMQAVRLTGLEPLVLSGAAPDNAGAVLGKIGLAPTTGIGNLANIIPTLRKASAAQLNTSLEQVQVLFIGHNQVAHSLRTQGTPGQAPFRFNVLVDGEDVTRQVNVPAIFSALPATLKHEYTQVVSAASALAVFEALVTNSPRILHAPGPNGLPGAYPLHVKGGALKVLLPVGMSLEEAIRIGEKGQMLDGIEQINDDGTVFFSEEQMAIMKETLGYECLKMPLEEIEYRARELVLKYHAFAEKFA